MRFGRAAIEESGIIPEHASAMARVATMANAIVMIRAPGEYATRLISLGYSAKSFHIKAKSCNFGPMAGFILEKPEFSKRGLQGATAAERRNHINRQTLDIQNAQNNYQVRTTDLTIPKAYKDYLFNKGYVKACVKNRRDVINVPGVREPRIIKCSATFKGTGFDQINSPQKDYSYFLVETANQTYDVYYRYLFGNPFPPILRVRALVDTHWNLADPNALPPGGGNYYVNGLPPVQAHLQATCADYDLFACWEHDDCKATHFANVQPGTYNRTFERVVTAQNLRLGHMNGEHVHFGNISPLLYNMLRYLNREFLRAGDRNVRQPMAQHSDECGRPGITEVDFPVFMAFPDGKKLYAQQEYARHGYLLLNDIHDFADLIQKVNDGGNHYKVNLHPRWTTRLTQQYPGRANQYRGKYYDAGAGNRTANQVIQIANTYRLI